MYSLFEKTDTKKGEYGGLWRVSLAGKCRSFTMGKEVKSSTLNKIIEINQN